MFAILSHCWRLFFNILSHENFQAKNEITFIPTIVFYSKFTEVSLFVKIWQV